MKKILLLLIAISSTFYANAQIAPEKLLGTWTLIKYDYGNGNTGDQTKSAFKKIKIFTAQTVTTLNFNKSGGIDSAHYASYRANERCCVLVGSPKPGFGVVAEEPIGNTGINKANKLSYTANIDSEGFLHATTAEYMVDPAVNLTVANRDKMVKTKTSEIWMPVKEKIWEWAGSNKKSFNGGTIATRFGFDDKVLLFLKTDDKTIELRSTTKFPMALGFLPEDELNAVEIFSDETAIQRYGIKGRFGALVIQLRDDYLPKAIAQLKKQKSID